MDTARTALRKSIKWNIEQITTANGYLTNVQKVYDPPKSIDAMPYFPCVNLHWGREDRNNETLMGNNELLDIRFECQMDFFFSESFDLPLAQDRSIADVQKRFGNNWYITDENGIRRAFNSVYLAAEVWGIEGQKPTGGVSIYLETFYRIKLTDPYSMTH